jgi:hypothetical protein
MTNDIEQLMTAGWRHWNKKPNAEGKVLVLCPEKVFADVPVGTVMESIFGQIAVKGVDDIDTDTRAGLLAYGIRVDPGSYGVES